MATRENLRLVVSNEDEVANDAGGVAEDSASMRVLIADQDGLARRMMQGVLRSAGGRGAAGEDPFIATARDGREALELVYRHRPTVLLIDVSLPPAGGAELIRTVMATLPRARVLTVSAAADQDRAVLEAFRAGAIGHIDKDIDPDQFAQLVALATTGEAVVPRRLMTPLLERWRRDMPAGGWRPMRSTLTTREWQIVELLADGASTEQITERLVLSQSTVYSHIYRLLHKLGVHTRRDAVAAARRLREMEASTRPPRALFGEAQRPLVSVQDA